MKTQKQIEIDRLAEFLKATSVIDQTIITTSGELTRRLLIEYPESNEETETEKETETPS